MKINRSLFEALCTSSSEKMPVDLDSINRAAQSLDSVLNAVEALSRPNITTLALADFIDVQLQNDDVDAGYIILIAPEEVAWHGRPDTRILHEGEIFTVDVACSYHGWWADSSATFPVGEIDSDRIRLIAAASEGTRRIIQSTKEGCVGREGAASLTALCKQYDVRLIPEAAGHRVGQSLHHDPVITYDGRTHAPLSQDQVYAVEPVFTNGNGKIRFILDGTAVTIDGKPTAHFETTVYLDDSGARVLGNLGWIAPVLS